MFRALSTIRLKLAVVAGLVVIIVLLPNLFALGFWPHIAVDFIILGFLVYFLSVYIGRPLGRLTSAVQDLGEGKLSARVDVRTGDELEQLGTAFNQMAENLERSLQEIKDQQAAQIRQAEFVAEASRLFSSSLDLPEILQAVMQKCSEVAGDFNAVMLLDKATGVLRIASHYHADVQTNERLRRVLEELPVRLGVGVSGTVAKTGQPILLKDAVSADVDPEQRIISEKVGGKSVLSVPLISRGEVIGVLTSAVITGTRSLTEADLVLIEEIAGHAADAILNAQLFAEVRRRVEEQTMLWEVAQGITSSLDLDLVLQTVVEKVADMLGAAGALVFLLNEDRLRLSIRAYCGIPSQIDERLQIHVGEGMVGLSAESGEIIQTEDLATDPRTKIPWLAAELELRSALFIPLVVRTHVIGVIGVYRKEISRFSESEIKLASTFGSLAAIAIENSKLYERERRIAETLQKSYMPEQTDIEGLDLATIYSPALPEAEIGGDFFDVFSIGDGRVGLIIADVSGKGLQASVYTIMTKYMIRGFAVDDPAPESVLGRLNKAICRYIPEGLFITVFYCVVDPKTSEITYANAGHEPPIVYDSTHRYIYNLDVTGAAVGALCDSEYQISRAVLRRGDLVVLYTDGVTESRRDGRLLGVQGLQEILLGAGGRSTLDIADEIYKKVLDFSGGKLHDDVALLVAGITGGKE